MTLRQTEIPGKFWMWCWRGLEKISWTDRVKNEEVLQRVKEVRNILYAIKRGKVKWIYHILCRKCLLNHVIAGKMEGRIRVTGRWGRGRVQPLDDRTETRGYWKLKDEALDRTVWGTRSYDRLRNEWMNVVMGELRYRSTHCHPDIILRPDSFTPRSLYPRGSPFIHWIETTASLDCVEKREISVFGGNWTLPIPYHCT